MNWYGTDKIEYLMLYQNEYAEQSTMHSVSESAIRNQSIVGSYISDINTTMNLTTYENDTINKLFPPAIFNEPKEFIFDRKEVRIIFITLYTLVFCCCFFGNLLVILVVTLSRRLRSITNFFLANLAVADFCVGIFCVLQNLSIYLIPSWVFGEFLCKMYQFVHSLSYTASIFILVVICMERYFAIIHPITCKQILTSKRLRLVIVLVWLTSALYSTPKFIFMNTITNTIGNETEIYCVPMRTKFDSETFDMLNFVLLYIVPLLIMTILYSRIAISLWKSSKGLGRNMQMKSTPMASSGSGNAFCRHPSKYEKRTLGTTESEVSMESDKNGVTTWRTHSVHNQRHHNHHNQHGQLSSHSSNNVLRARRGVVRMLMVVVLTFALCNLPLHARKMWQNWSDDYRGDSNFTALFTPLTFLVTYFNSGVNPLLYAFLSRNFRKGMSELLICSLKQNKSKALNKRTVTHVSKLNSVVISNNDNDNSINKMDQLNNTTDHNTSCNDSISVH